jgi:hypothetical protein
MITKVIAKALKRVPTKDFIDHPVEGRLRVWLVPTKHIQRTGYKYKAHRVHVRNQVRYTEVGETHGMIVNRIRRSIRQGKIKDIPPVPLMDLNKHIGRSTVRKKKYMLWDGHHRLTGHQAEGRKYIRAIFVNHHKHHWPDRPDIRTHIFSNT